MGFGRGCCGTTFKAQRGRLFAHDPVKLRSCLSVATMIGGWISGTSLSIGGRPPTSCVAYWSPRAHYVGADPLEVAEL